MKQLHREDLYGWSTFDTDRNMDFHGTAWIRERGNVLIDPVPMSDHDFAHLKQLGGASWVVITNSDHIRDADELARKLWAKLAAPAAEQRTLELACDRWLADGEDLVEGLRVMELEGSKTPGELALFFSPDTLLCGDLVRGPRGGRLDLLPDAKLEDKSKALASVRRLAEIEGLEAVLVGDGWPVFRDGRARLLELLDRA